MFELFTEGVTLLNAISLLAFFTTVGLFFCGFPICRQILKRKGTKEISGAPFMMGVVGGSCWWTYGFLKHDQTLLYVTSTQVVLYSSYLIFYWFMTQNKIYLSKFVISFSNQLNDFYLIVITVINKSHVLFYPLKKLINLLTCNTSLKVSDVEPDAGKLCHYCHYSLRITMFANVSQEIGNVFQKYSKKDQ
uniref:Sugar transporter SWEET1 n=1 Tax=Syphacia muris TaxID=451379 RepID=A0A0N5AMI0_9BILA